MRLEFIEARDLPDAWFQCVYRVLEKGREYTIERGSYQGQKRLEFDYVTVHIKYPGVRPLLPDIPPSLGIPNPVAEGYLEQYLPYLMTSARQEGEEYTYGQYLERQVEEVIRMYKEDGHATNQAYMTVGEPGCIFQKDPPCLRGID
ncbi:MAG: thymidylate synthase, partial [Deltaproteobacteria bacterium HGW-Deltaproteobacteria-15]